jgi:hypothetical protein
MQQNLKGGGNIIVYTKIVNNNNPIDIIARGDCYYINNMKYKIIGFYDKYILLCESYNFKLDKIDYDHIKYYEISYFMNEIYDDIIFKNGGNIFNINKSKTFCSVRSNDIDYYLNTNEQTKQNTDASTELNNIKKELMTKDNQTDYDTDRIKTNQETIAIRLQNVLNKVFHKQYNNLDNLKQIVSDPQNLISDPATNKTNINTELTILQGKSQGKPRGKPQGKPQGKPPGKPPGKQGK